MLNIEDNALFVLSSALALLADRFGVRCSLFDIEIHNLPCFSNCDDLRNLLAIFIIIPSPQTLNPSLPRFLSGLWQWQAIWVYLLCGTGSLFPFQDLRE